MRLLGIDVGTTHIKAGLFLEDGKALRITVLPNNVYYTAEGYPYYDPEVLWSTVVQCIRLVMNPANAEEENADITCIGVSSMAETGLLLDRETGSPRSHFIPWFDTRTISQYEKIANLNASVELFQKTGLYPSHKYALTRILWLKDKNPSLLDNAVWLSTADYVVYRLTGQMATDYTLAARTYAFDIAAKEWHTTWLREWGISREIFPEVGLSGVPQGMVQPQILTLLGLRGHIPISIAGHDHLCAALAAGVVEPGCTFDSMGTAETLIGVMEAQPLNAGHVKSGLVYGRHVVPDKYFWLGGLPASGGSVEWLRKLLGEQQLSYKDLKHLLEKVEEPTGILYYPYLAGSGAPLADPKVRGAFIGLAAAHQRSEMVRAVLEGTAYEMESIRRAAVLATGQDIARIIAVGGGTYNSHWMQIKADVSNCTFELFPEAEATLLGAALLAGIGTGVYGDAERAHRALKLPSSKTVEPDSQKYLQYQRIYENGYVHFQEPLRTYHKNFG